MPRYLKLGVSKSTDRDTSLFQTAAVPDLSEEQRTKSWPALRRVHSSRERLEEAPRRSVTCSYPASDAEQQQQQQQQHQHQQNVVVNQTHANNNNNNDGSNSGFLLRRAKSSREAFSQHSCDNLRLGSLDEETNRNTNKFNNSSNNNSNSGIEQNSEFDMSSKKFDNRFSKSRNGSYVSAFAKQVQSVASLPRTQSMRYNRIVSAESDERDDDDLHLHANGIGGGGIVPPRHSCVDKVQRLELNSAANLEHEGNLIMDQQLQQKLQGGGGMIMSSAECKKMIRVSASYQTSDGEILSIECAQCGRWLGTVAQRVNLDEGTLKLCQICHPNAVGGSIRATSGAARTAETTGTGTGSNSKKGNGFIRGLRKMFGLKKGR